MLAPSLEALDSLETLGEGLKDGVYKATLVGEELDPVVLDVRGHLAVLLDDRVIFVFTIVFWL